MANPRNERARMSAPGRRLAATAAALAAALALPAAGAGKRCDWHGPKTRGETSYKRCVDYAGLDGEALALPENVTRISQDGISFCPGVFNGTKGAADIIFMMDNSASMEQGESGGGYNTPPGDPNGVRDRVIRRAMRQQRATADTATAAFISFFGLGREDYRTTREIETQKLQRPLDISRLNPSGEANLNTLLRKVYKHNPNEALLPKAGAAAPAAKSAKTAKTAMTYWSESLLLARAWLSPDSGFTKTRNHAIVMVSDGAIGDWKDVQALVPTLPPVYGIHLGGEVNATNLRDLCTLTGGQFYRVDPGDTAQFAELMSRIVGTITKNPLPKAIQVTNSAWSTPQVSVDRDLIANPDGSLGVVLDSIIGLKPGANPISIRVTRDDNTVTDWSFRLDVAAAAIDAGSETYSCYDMPTLSVVDSRGDTVEVYGSDATTQNVRLVRSPSELDAVTVVGTSESGDTERLPFRNPSGASGYPVHTGSVKFNGRDGSPTPGNGTLEVGDSRNVTLTWSHPRDPRETDTYILLGRKVPTLDATVDIKGPDEPVRGVEIQDPPKGDPIVILDRNGRCVTNCTGKENLVRIHKENLPTWSATVRSPVTLTMRIFDNLGQFVNESHQKFTPEQWDALPKEGDSARVSLHYLPIAKTGQPIATGAYLMKMIVVGEGGGLRTNSAGELIELKPTHQEYFKRFGYIRE